MTAPPRTVRLAWLQLGRARLRSALLVSAVAGLTALVLLVSTISSTLLGSLGGAIRTLDADVLVMTTAAQGTVQASRVGPAAAAEVGRVEGVDAVEPVGETRVTVSVAGERLDASVFGVPEAAPGLPGQVVSGRLPARHGEVVMDRSDLSRGLAIGTHLEVVGTTTRLEIVGVTAESRFAGIVTLFAPYRTWESMMAELFPDAQELRPSLLAVRAQTGTDPDVLAERITGEVAGLSAATPAVAGMRLPGLSGIRDSFRLIGVIAAGSALLLVGCFWSLTTAHQQRVLALLRAIGVTRSTLVRSLLVQVLTVVGSGVSLAVVALWLAGRTVPPTFPLTPDPGSVALLAGLLLVGSLAACLPAVRRIQRTDPATALAQADR